MDLLKKMIDPDFGLLVKLFSCQILEWSDLERIKRRETVDERNVSLLKLLTDKSSEDRVEFLNCLNDCMQRHVYNYICRNRGLCVNVAVKRCVVMLGSFVVF